MKILYPAELTEEGRIKIDQLDCETKQIRMVYYNEENDISNFIIKIVNNDGLTITYNTVTCINFCHNPKNKKYSIELMLGRVINHCSYDSTNSIADEELMGSISLPFEEFRDYTIIFKIIDDGLLELKIEKQEFELTAL